MHTVKSILLGLVLTLTVFCVSSSAFAATFTTPFGSSAVEIYVGYRYASNEHVILWKRQYDGKCNKVTLPSTGEHWLYGSSKADLIHIVWEQKTISCLGGATHVLQPSAPTLGTLYVKGGSGNDTMLLTHPAWYGYGEAGDDLMVAVDGQASYLSGGGDNDVIEVWGTGLVAVVEGGGGNDCMWSTDFIPMGGGDQHDKCSTYPLAAECEELAPCCAFGAFMGVCQP